MEFENLVGKVVKFYGVDNLEFKLDRNVWVAIENEDDGYRSYLDSVVVSKSDGIFFRKSLAKVRIDRYEKGDFDGYVFIDIDDGHCWLRVGTDNSDDYYPVFIFEYQPKKR